MHWKLGFVFLQCDFLFMTFVRQVAQKLSTISGQQSSCSRYFVPPVPILDLRRWFCAASPCLLPALTPRCPPERGGWCPHETFQTSCGRAGELRLARTGWRTCEPMPAGGPGPLAWAASSWQSRRWRKDHGERSTRDGWKESHLVPPHCGSKERRPFLCRFLFSCLGWTECCFWERSQLKKHSSASLH